MKEYGFSYLKFDLLGNVEDDAMSKEEKESLSSQRAEVVKEKLIEAGAIKENIVLHAKSDKAPMYTN